MCSWSWKMTNTINLTKIYIKETLCRTFNIKGKKKFSSTALVISLLFVLMAFAMGYNLYLMAKSLNSFGFAKNILLIGSIFSAFIVLMFTITDTQGHFYKTKDFEMLSSLPLKQREIVFSKLLSSYIVTAIYSALIMIPTFVVYFIFCKITIANAIFALFALLFAPAFSQLLCSVFAWLINAISSRMKNKMLMRSILSVFFAIGITIIIYFANNDTLTALLSTETPVWFKIVFPFAYFLQKAMVENSILQYLLFVAVSLAYLAVAIVIIMLGYNRINKNLLVSNTKKPAKQKPLTYKQKSVVSSLLGREARGFVMSPTYLMNGIMGPLLAIVLSFVMYGIYDSLKIPSQLVVNFFVALEVFTIPLCIGIAPTTSVSISMEGTRFLNLKSMPVRFKDIAFSKILFNVIINLPCLLIGEIAFCLLLKPGVVLSVMIVLFGVAYLVMCSGLGLLINLRFPKLNWTNEAQASKQGLSLIITMFIDMAICLLPMILYFALLDKLFDFSLALYIGLFTIPVAIVAVVVYILLATLGTKLYKKIN